MAPRRPFWKWSRWKSIGFYLWPPSTCIWNWNSEANLTYAPETMSSTDRRTDGRTDGQTDGRTDGQGESSIPPSNFVGRGCKDFQNIINVYFSSQNEFYCVSRACIKVLQYVQAGVSPRIIWKGLYPKALIPCILPYQIIHHLKQNCM